MYRITMFLVAATLASGVVHTAAPPAPNLSGTYLLDHSKSDDPRHAIEDATSSMGRFKRNAVRSRLGDALKPADTLRIATHGDTVSLANSGRMRLATVPGGAPKSRTGEKGGTMSLASAWSGDTLVVKTTSEKFQREARYSLESDSSAMRVAITMSLGASDSPVHYVLVYRRSAADSSAS
jgi:hypothetical protein